MQLFPNKTIQSQKQRQNKHNSGDCDKKKSLIKKKCKHKHKHSNLLKDFLNKGMFSMNNSIPRPTFRPFNVKLKQLNLDESVSHDTIRPNAILPNTSIYYTPSQLVTVYGLNKLSLPASALRGSGITIAVIIAYHYANLQNDFNSYCTYFGLPTKNLIIQSFTKRRNSGWAEECCLDTQAIHTVAPGSNIMVVEAASASSNDLLIAIKYAVNKGANVVSMSWGGAESPSFINTFDTYFATVPNVCFVASSGDAANIVNYPSSSPNVISVGGTNITRNADGTRNTETPWFNNMNYGTGNGYSAYINKPSYQTGIANILGSKRCTPDISLVADPNSGFVVNYAGSYYVFGGTSLAAPLMAGFLAIANQIRKTNKKPLLSTVATNTLNIQNYMYQTIYAKNTNYTSSTPYTANMYDITSGSFNAGIGYDIASGLGSLNPNILCNTLNNI